MQKYGFVYIWYDRKHKRYYIGCHWGFEGDGYICSSNWMRDSFRRRPEDFKGPKILARIYTNRKELHEEEYRWLQMIKDEELGKRYYNLRKQYYPIDDEKLKIVSEKISKANTGRYKGIKLSEEHKRKISMNHSRYMLGRKHSEESIKIMSDKKKGDKHPLFGKHLSEETKKKMSMKKKGVKQTEEARRINSECHKGLKQSEETIKKKIKANTGKKRSEETKKKMSEAQKKRFGRL